MPAIVDDILTAASVAQAISGFLGLTKEPVELLAEGKFDAGREALDDAYTADSEEDRKELVKDARRKFHEAIRHEKGLRKAFTHLGLALCYQHLGELPNAKKHAKKVLTVKPPGVGSSIKATMKDVIPVRGVAKSAISKEHKRKLQLARAKIKEVKGDKSAANKVAGKVMKMVPFLAAGPLGIALGASMKEDETILLEYERICLQELKDAVGRVLESGVMELPVMKK